MVVEYGGHIHLGLKRPGGGVPRQQVAIVIDFESQTKEIRDGEEVLKYEGKYANMFINLGTIPLGIKDVVVRKRRELELVTRLLHVCPRGEPSRFIESNREVYSLPTSSSGRPSLITFNTGGIKWKAL